MTRSTESDELIGARTRWRAAIAEIRAILRADLPEFVQRSVRDYYLEHAEESGAMSAEAIATLKRRTAEVGSDFTSIVDAWLDDESVWANVEGLSPDARAGLDTHFVVWERVRTVSEAAASVLREAGYSEPTDGFGIAYRPPARFIDGKYLRTAMESFWRALDDIERLSAEERERSTLLTRQELIRRWDEN